MRHFHVFTLFGVNEFTSAFDCAGTQGFKKSVMNFGIWLFKAFNVSSKILKNQYKNLTGSQGKVTIAGGGLCSCLLILVIIHAAVLHQLEPIVLTLTLRK